MLCLKLSCPCKVCVCVWHTDKKRRLVLETGVYTKENPTESYFSQGYAG